jgi:hypothetical protein
MREGAGEVSWWVNQGEEHNPSPQKSRKVTAKI